MVCTMALPFKHKLKDGQIEKEIEIWWFINDQIPTANCLIPFYNLTQYYWESLRHIKIIIREHNTVKSETRRDQAASKDEYIIGC